MGIQLMRFPDEILLAVISCVEEQVALQSVALTCRRFQRLAEPLIYRSMVILRGENAKYVASSMDADPRRASMVEDLLVSCPFESWDGVEQLQDFLPRMPKLKSLRVETPDCNQKRVDERRHWRQIQSQYESIFRQASLLTSGQHCLTALRSCTIHFVDHTRSLYTIDQYAGILLHPSLEHLSLSCACLSETVCDLLQDRSRVTSLKSLVFEQCDFAERALTAILSLPKALESLHLSENYHDPPLVGWLTPAAYTRALRQQAHTLSHLTLLLAHPTHSPYHNSLEKYNFSLFPNLVHFNFGQVPFYLFTNGLEGQEHFSRKSRINLDQITFPPNLEHFRYSDIQTFSFDENLEILKNVFYRSSSPSTQPTTLPAKGTLKNLDIILPIDSHDHIHETLLHHLARASPHFHDIGIRYCVYDTEGPRGYIPPYLYAEPYPDNTLIIDSDRLNFANSQLMMSRVTRANIPIPNSDDENDQQQYTDIFRSKQSILPAANRSAANVSRLRRRAILDITWMAENVDGGPDWEDAIMNQVFDPQYHHMAVIPSDEDVIGDANEMIFDEDEEEEEEDDEDDDDDDYDDDDDDDDDDDMSDYVDVPEETLDQDDDID